MNDRAQRPEPTARLTARLRVGPALAGYRLDQFIQRMIPRLSRARVQKAIAARVRLSWDAPVKASTPVREGGVVFIDDPELKEEVPPFEPAILFEDDDLLAIDKPPGIVVHPTNAHYHHTVITRLRRQRDEPNLTLAHRLDAETSGVLLMGRHRWAARRVQTSFERGRVGKRYLALVHGRPEWDEIVIERPLGTFSRDQFVYRQSSEADDARPCRSHVRVVERGPTRSLVEVEPRSGRRHQIRAHLAEEGYPIVGDKLYGLDDRDYRRYLRAGALDEELLGRLGAPRLMLHNRRLEIDHPRERTRRLVLEAPVPADMMALLREARVGA